MWVNRCGQGVRWTLGVVAAGPVVGALGGGLERWLIAAATVALALATCGWKHRWVTRAAGLLVSTTVVSLALHYLLDHFDYHLVWLYSAASLPGYLKVANLWGNDEGTLLMLGWLLTLFAVYWRPRDPWTHRGAACLALFFLLASLWWNPFAQTPPEVLARSVSQGANAHLLTPWMAIHPPLVLASYALLLAPLGALLGTLSGATTDWIELSGYTTRAAWFLLSGGIAVGMWWAYEDLTFGQFWHWDPVQTSLFAVWVLLTAQLHMQRSYQLSQARCFTIWHPQLAGWCAVVALLAMAVTRSPLLTSSHRYVGETSMSWLLLGAVLLSATLVLLPLVSERREARSRLRNGAVLWLGIGTLICAALIALGHLVHAVMAEWLDWPRDGSLRPFFETVVRWTDAGEAERLREAFSQWEVNPFAVNRWLLPIAAMGLLLLGHLFQPLNNHRLRRVMTLLVGVIGAAAAFFGQPFTRHYDGTGMTSQQTTAVFPWIDLLLLYGLFAMLALLLFSAAGAWRWHQGAPLAYRHLPLGLLHGGAALTLIALLAATVFDSYGQRMVELPAQYGVALDFPDGYQVTIEPPQTIVEPDDAPGFRAVAAVNWRLWEAGQVLQSRSGETMYHDSRRATPAARGSVRQLCELLDYRYARFTVEPQRMLRPFIHRGVWRDVQLWLALPAAHRSEDGQWRIGAGSVPAVLKVYPLASWVWVGLCLMLVTVLMRWRGYSRKEMST